MAMAPLVAVKQIQWKICKKQETFEMSTNDGAFICRKKLSDNLLGVFFGHNPLKSSFPLVLFELIFLIFVSRVVRLLLKPFGQPKVISEIIVSEFWFLVVDAHYVFVEMFV